MTEEDSDFNSDSELDSDDEITAEELNEFKQKVEIQSSILPPPKIFLTLC